jgi:hypothetical protein
VSFGHPLSQQFQLCAHCYTCDVRGRVLVLDIRDATHILFPEDIASALSDRIAGWPTLSPGEVSPPVADSERIEDAISLLLRNQLIELEQGPKNVDRDNRLPTPIRPLLDEYEYLDVRVNAMDLFRFARAALRAAWILNGRPKDAYLKRTIHGLQEENRSERPERERTIDVDGMKRALAVYRRLRPFLWKSKLDGWLKTLVLKGFLKHSGYEATWVCAVMLDPVSFYTWLQTDDIVVGDPPGVVTRFVPIVCI